MMGKVIISENRSDDSSTMFQSFDLNSVSENDRTFPLPKEKLKMVSRNYPKQCQNDCLATKKNPCEFCILSKQLRNFYEWFPRLGEHNKRVFLVGLIQRLNAYPLLLRRLCEVLSPTMRKDFMYAISRTAPSLETDFSTVSRDRTLSTNFVNKAILLTWDWYEKVCFWSKVNFLMIVLQSCDVHLLHVVNNCAKALLEKGNEEIATPSTTKDQENPDGHKDFSTSSSANEFPIEIIPGQDDAYSPETRHKKNRMIQSSKRRTAFKETYYRATCQFKDFIYCLPAHLAKYILSLLDEASLTNAFRVSKKWRQLTNEVIEDFILGQQVREEAMILQGTSSQGVNPIYAKDIDVPVPNVIPNTWLTIPTDEPVIRTTYRSEATFTVAYSGLSTRKVIMEERNIYCGAYNVMVLKNVEDPHRVVHTNGGELIAIGSNDRKVRFIDSSSGKSVNVVIKGHAGSIKCVWICEKKRIVLSGSYDTSIRCWSIDSGKCIRIFRGHRDTVVVLHLLHRTLASGSKDGSCKVWDLESGKCLWTFRHNKPVQAVAMSSKIVLSGCDGGKVNVWHKDTGQLIKKLAGHTEPITSIRLDRWHIVTGSKDSYAMIWSAVGDHSRCLRALKHPKEVCCVQLLYIRVITGSNDGRIRIWNLFTGQCCRIMRGNSYSDPIVHLIPIGNRILVNTHTNLLVLQFEEIEWNYDLENDNLPPLVKSGSYSDVPIQKKTYSYIRAKRMEKVGASNMKILQTNKLKGENKYLQSNSGNKDHKFQNVCQQIHQLDHSARLLSAKSLAKARFIQQFGILYNNQKNLGLSRSLNKTSFSSPNGLSVQNSKVNPLRSMSPMKVTLPTNDENLKKEDSKTAADVDCESCEDPKPRLERRSSWAFDRPKELKDNVTSLSEMKILLRSQIRSKGEKKVPAFIQETIKAYHGKYRGPNEYEIFDEKIRPLSSPGKIDTKTKILFDPSQLAQLKVFKPKDRQNSSPKILNDNNNNTHNISYVDDMNNSAQFKAQKTQTSTTTMPTKCSECINLTEIQQKIQLSKSKLPRGLTFHCMSAIGKNSANSELKALHNRPHTTVERCLDRSEFSTKRISSSAPSIREPLKLVQFCDYRQKVDKFRTERKAKRLKEFKETPHCRVTPLNDPMRNHVKFYLRTQTEEEKVIEQMREREKELRERLNQCNTTQSLDTVL